jgi:hypothetical protein
MRKLFLGRNLHDHFINRTSFGHGQRQQPFQAGVNKAGSFKASRSRNQNIINQDSGPHDEKVIAMTPSTRFKTQQDQYSMVDAQNNPYDLGNIVAPVRKWYQPIFAWYD